MGKKRRRQKISTWDKFCRRQAGQPFLANGTLYALTEKIVDAVKAEVPDFFTPKEERFERDLARTASFGFFHCCAMDLPVHPGPAPKRGFETRHARSSRDLQEMLATDYARSGISANQIKDLFEQESERTDFVERRQDAYVGWLVTNRQFRTELKKLRRAWGNDIKSLRRFPIHPRWNMSDPLAKKKLRSGFLDDFLAFYRRWCLDRLHTWEWPQPMGPDVVGGMVDARSLATETGVAFFIPWYILRDGKLDVQELVRASQQTRPPNHLREWVQKTGSKKMERGDIRYERQAWLYRFLNLALKARYPIQCRGKAEKLDNAFAAVLDIDAQSIRKSRQVLERALRQKSPKCARAR
jgi:hypothetical protein